GVMGAGSVCLQRQGRHLEVRVGREEEGASSQDIFVNDLVAESTQPLVEREFARTVNVSAGKDGLGIHA
ncbi:MAG: hypothetical protein ACK55Z_02925, partial [bacterium]